MNWFQNKRLDFIAQHLSEVGYINRSDLVKEFGICTVQASLDLKTFMAHHPGYTQYNGSTKRYELEVTP